MLKKYGFWLLVLLWLIYILSFVDRQIIAVLASQIRPELALSNFQVGILYGAAFSFVYAFAGIPMGWLADRFSRAKMIAIGLFAWSLVTVASGFAASFATLVVFRMILGLSQAMLSPAAYALLAETFPEKHRSKVFSVYASGIFIGVGASFLVGGTVSELYDWRTAMIAVGVPGLLLAPVAWFFIRDAASAKVRSGYGSTVHIFEQLRWMLKKRTIRWHLVGFAALACTGYSVLSSFGTIMAEVFGAPHLIRHYGWFLFGVALTVYIAGHVADKLAVKHPARRFYIGYFAALGAVPLYFLGLFADTGFTALILLGTAVLISSCYNGVAASLIQFLVKPETRALAGGLYLFVISVAGFGFGPPVTGLLADVVFTGQYAMSKALMSVILFCSLVGTVSFKFAIDSYDEDRC